MRIFISILILTSFTFAIYSAEAAVITVCSSGCNSTTVQGGINVASNNDEVRIIDSREYNEAVDINKAIHLTSNVTPLPTIYRSSSVNPLIDITVNNVNISKLNIKLNISSCALSSSVIRISSVDNILIKNSKIEVGPCVWWGINIQSGASNNTIINNNITSDKVTGLRISGSTSSYNLISNNNFDVYQWGNSLILESSASNNTITNNSFIVNDYGTAIYTEGSSTSYNLIRNNDILINGGDGIDLRSSNNELDNNRITSYDTSGYGILLRDASNNILENSNITTFKDNGYGIYLWSSSSNNILLNNTIVTSGDTAHAIFIGANSNNNNITSHTIKTYNTSAYGVFFNSSTNNRVFDSIINATNASDIRLRGTDSLENYIINSSYNKSDISFYFLTDTIKLYHQYYLDVYVNDTSGNPINQTNVSAWDKYNTFAFSQLTNSSGYIPRQVLSEFIANATPYNATSGYYYFTNYTVNATKASYDPDEKQVNLTQSMSTFLTLSQDQTSPQYFDNSTNSTAAGEPVEFRLKWTDDVALDSYVFSLDNCTGSFSNITETNFTTGGTEDWSNETYVINSTIGCTIRWKVYANDTSNNWNVSDVSSFITLPSYCEIGIESVPYTINQDNTYYCLIKDVYSTSNVITFSSDIQNSTLDCLGHNIDGNDGSNYGVYLQSNDINNTVKNCNITDVDYGVYIFGGKNYTIINNTANSNDAGFYLRNTEYNSLINNTANDNSYGGIMYGFYLYDSDYNYITNNTANRNQYGIVFSNSENNIIENNVFNENTVGYYVGAIYVTANSHNNSFVNNIANYNDIGIILDDSNDNSFVNNTVSGNGDMGFWLSSGTAANNNMTGGSVWSNTYDYTLSKDGTTNYFRNTNFTESRTIRFFGTSYWFTYNNEPAEEVWLRTKIDDSVETITRNITNWNNTLMVWDDSASTALTATYNIAGLNANKYYNVYNNSVLAYSLQTNSSGDLPSFAIYLSSEHEIKVEEDQTSPKYYDNSTNNTVAGQPTLFSLNWTDNVGLDSYIFSFDNCTGSLVNDSAVAMTGTGNWSNVTKVVNSTIGGTIQWRVYANDTSNNWNASDTYSFVTIEYPTTTTTTTIPRRRGGRVFTTTSTTTVIVTTTIAFETTTTISLRCPTCLGCSDWSPCVNNQTSRTCHVCDESTGYVCQPYTETKSCEKPEIKSWIDTLRQHWYVLPISMTIPVIFIFSRYLMVFFSSTQIILKKRVSKYISEIDSPVTVMEVAVKMNLDKQTAEKILLKLVEKRKIKSEKTAEKIWLFSR